jgi:hypothetical protein
MAMKRNQFVIILASVLASTSIGASNIAIAQPSSGMKQTYCRESTRQARFGPSDPNWQAEFAGISLSSEQTERVCQLKATLDKEAFGRGFKLGQLFEWANTGSQGEEAFKRSPIAGAIRKYNANIQQVLTPEQYQQWVRNGGGER